MLAFCARGDVEPHRRRYSAMTAGVLIVDGKGDILLQEEGEQRARTSTRNRRRYCVMNTVALLCVTLLLLLVVVKLIFALRPDLFAARPATCSLLKPNRTFSVSGSTFLKDGRPFQYISGSMHYSRVPAAYWRDRLAKMRAAGLDAVQTYVPWNFHQAAEGASEWAGDRDLPAFVRTAQEEGLLVILRAGPYICAEWDFGGLPAWLMQKNASMRIRSSDPEYLRYMDVWMTELLAKMRPLLYQNGGPIIMVQLENEYGSYPTCDKKYVSHLYDLGRKVLGPDIILFTTDGNSAGYLRCGALDPRYLATVDFGTGTANNPEAAFAALRKIRPTGPLVNSEYYVGWLDTWGSGHAHVAVEPIVQGLRAMYRYNASINMYMFFGGTNFAYWNGAEAPPYNPQVTSYDYDAPLSEAGDMTWKYQRLREAIHELKGQPLRNASGLRNATVLPYGPVKMEPACHFVSLLPSYPQSKSAGQPLRSMESYGVLQGYAVYSAYVDLSAGAHKLVLPAVRDRAYVFTADGGGRAVSYHGAVVRDKAPDSVSVVVSSGAGAFLHVLVENGGHVNYGSHMQGDVKGLFGNVTLDGAAISAWHFFHLELTKKPYRLQGCDTSKKPPQGMFFSVNGYIKFLEGPNDTYVMPTSFQKGQLMINTDAAGSLMNVGRYWPVRGPQKTLFVPRTFLRRGVNLVVLFETEGVNGTCPGDCSVTFGSRPQLGAARRTEARGRGRAA